MLSLHLAEIAPAAPLLPPLAALVALIVALGLIVTGKLIVSAFFGVAKGIVNQTVGRIPWLGGKVSGKIESVEKRLVGYMEHAVVGLESGIAATWHNLARAAAHMGYTIAHLSRAAYHVWWLVHVKYPLAIIETLAHAGVRNAKELWKRIDHLAHQTTYVTRVITRPERGPIAQGARAATKPLRGELDRLHREFDTRLAALEQTVGVALPNALPHVGAEVDVLRRGLDWTRGQVRRHSKLLGASAMAGAVAYALGKLGAGWVRCGNVRNVGRRLCGMNPSALDDLLGLTLAIVGTISLVEFAEELQGIVGEVADDVHRLIREK